jgi:hypothetical protein
MDARLAPDPLPAARVERDARLELARRLADGSPWVELRAACGPAAGEPAPEGASVVEDDFAPPRLDALLRAGVVPGALVTAFDTLEYLPTFAPLVEALLELAAEREATVLLAVPNDDYGDIADATRTTTWTEGAVAELRSLLPAEAVVLAEVPLRGVAVVEEGAPVRSTADVTADAGLAPAGWILAFGPRAASVPAAVVSVAGADLREERRAWRAAQSELAYLRARLAALER